MMAYPDTNFLCRIYLEFEETGDAETLLIDWERAGSPPLPVTWLTEMEMTNALQRYVFGAKSGASPRVNLEAAMAVQAQFHDDLHAGTMLQPSELTLGALRSTFETLALRHTAKHGFRTYDIIHVAAALVLGCGVFWTFDAMARKLAKLEGLNTN